MRKELFSSAEADAGALFSCEEDVATKNGDRIKAAETEKIAARRGTVTGEIIKASSLGKDICPLLRRPDEKDIRVASGALIGICLGRLERLRALFKSGGVFGTAELAKRLRFRG
jgi:hypothetical protein